MSEEEAIEKLKKVAIEGRYGDERKDAIETLATFGEKATAALAEIAVEGRYGDERKLAMEKIKQIKEKTKTS